MSAWRFAPGDAEPAAIEFADALANVAEPGLGTVWIDLVAPSEDELRELDATADLGEFLLEDLREGAADAGRRTKLEQHGAVFHVAVRDVSVLGRRIVEREIDLVFGPGWCCSIRHPRDYGRGPDPDPDPFPIDEVGRRLRNHAIGGRDAIDEGMVLWAVLDVVTDRYLAVTDAIDERLDAAEALLLDDDGGSDRAGPTGSPRELFDIGRLLTEFRHQVIPLREVVGALLRREYSTLGPAALPHLRDVYDHLLGTVELVESQRDVLAGLRDVHLTVASNRMNRSMQQLAAWGAILIVATLITGVLGMNFRDAPNVGWRTGFLTVVAVITVITVPMWWFFRRRKWL